MSEKKRTTVYLDEGLFNQAKTRGDNLSEVLNDALVENTEEMAQCKFCKLFCDEAMAKEKFTWLCPDECWICHECFEQKTDDIKRTGIVAKL